MTDLRNAEKIHLTAICGTAMGALAAMLTEKGYKVTGSDDGVYPPMSDYLRSLGINIMEGFRPENLDHSPDAVIIGNTVKKINPEAQEIERRGIPFMHLPGAISEYFLSDRVPVVIAGTHGKTTTTSLCAWVFESAGLDPGFLVGGILKNFNANSRVGTGPHFIIEGDEYDSAYFDKVPKMWHYQPQTAALLSVEFDHGDIYQNLDQIREAFAKFVCMIPPTGFLAVCADYEDALLVSEPAVCTVVTYGYSEDAQARIVDLQLDEKGSRFTLKREGVDDLIFRCPMWGAHNASNAAAVALIAMHHGLSPQQIQKGFDTFSGIKRRQEVIYDENGILIIDDFAHHPTKVRETVKAVRSRFPGRRLISVYEPRTNTSRRNFFQDIYPASFDGSDLAIIAGVYNLQQLNPDEALNPSQLALSISERGIPSLQLEGADEIVKFLSEEARPGDVILIMSNGGFGGIYKSLPAGIAENTGKFREPAVL